MPLLNEHNTKPGVVAWLHGNKVSALFIAGILLYLLLTMAVLYWYQDDVEQMTWVDREVFNHKIISQYQLSDNISQQQVLNCAAELEIDWFALALQQYQKKYGDSTATEYKEKLKRMAYLQRRGFNNEQIQFAINFTE